MAINVKEFNEALEQIEVAKGISRETVLEALTEAMTKGFKKDLGADDAMVEVNIDIDKGIIEMFQLKNVVEDVQDDLLEIDVKEAGKGYKVGDVYKIPASVEKLRKAIVLSIKSVLRQKFAEAEKEILFEQFKDKIGTLITGRVEQIDERGAYVNIGRTSIYLQRKNMIRDEKFNVGDSIKLFVEDVDNGNKGAQIVVTRASEGFLKALMSEEIHDIYDGTIVIKAAAREAGERSKVAVYSNDLNVDPAGTCIGPNGSRIQKVVAQLGDGTNKEKIDIIAYTENTPLYIMESLKPARVVGIKVDEENKSALVIVKDDSFSLAIGRKGVNARLAVKLTGYSIDIKKESEALESGLEFDSIEEINALELEAKALKVAQAQRESLVYPSDISLPGLPEGYVAPQARKYEEETNDFDSALEEVAEQEEEVATPVVNEVKEEKVEEVKEAPVATPKEEVKAEVKTTTTLEDLEKSLADSEKKSDKKVRKNKKQNKEEEEEKVVINNEGPRMSIYTEEELKAMEEEEEEEDIIDDDDIDYDEYDQYYDED